MKETVSITELNAQLVKAIEDNDIRTIIDILKTEEGRESLAMMMYNNYKTLLHFAISKGRKEIVKEILKTEEGRKLLTVKMQNIMWTALHCVGCKGDEYKDVVEWILEIEEGRKSLAFIDHNGYTPLSWAAFLGHKEIVKAILKTEEGRKDLAIPDNKGDTPLQLLLRRGHYDIVEEILETEEGRKSLTITNNYGHTPLYWAACRGNKYIVEMILKTEEGKQIADKGGLDLSLSTLSISAGDDSSSLSSPSALNEQRIKNASLNDILNKTSTSPPEQMLTSSFLANAANTNSEEVLASTISGLAEITIKTSSLSVLEQQRRSSNDEQMYK